MRDINKLYVNLTGFLLVFIVTVSSIYINNPSLNLYNYILFAVNILLIIITPIIGIYKSLLLTIIILLGYGAFLIYFMDIGNLNNQSILSAILWFLIYPVSIYLSGNVSLWLNKFAEPLAEDSIGFDSETGLYNLRVFYKRIREEIARMEVDKQKLYLGIIKIKYFKELISVYGKDVQGLVLMEVTKNIIDVCNGYEFKARLSKNCFGIIISAVNIEQKEIEERLTKSLKKQKIYLENYDKCIQIETQIGIGEYINGENEFEFKNRVEQGLRFDLS